jgi:hypothetical protein
MGSSGSGPPAEGGHPEQAQGKPNQKSAAHRKQADFTKNPQQPRANNALRLAVQPDGPNKHD